MRIVRYGAGGRGAPCVLLLGYFDGVHLGHRALIAAAKKCGVSDDASVLAVRILSREE